MILTSIFFPIVAIALLSINSNISSLLYIRIASIIFIYTGVLSFNTLYIQSIGSGIGVYNGLFQVTLISQFFDIFIVLIGSLILVSSFSYHILIITTLLFLSLYFLKK